MVVLTPSDPLSTFAAPLAVMESAEQVTVGQVQLSVFEIVSGLKNTPPSTIEAALTGMIDVTARTMGTVQNFQFLHQETSD
jgi:hypothetical protein